MARVLYTLNNDKGVGPDEVKQVINELKLKGSGPESSKQIINMLKSGVPVKFEKDRLVKYVRLIDYDKISNNEFIVSRQVTHTCGDDSIRNDLLLYVNGIPLVSVECKNPASFSEDWHSAYRQIKEYEKKVPELYKYVQIGVAAEQVAKYFPIVPWQDEVKVYEWKVEGLDRLEPTLEMLRPSTLLTIIRDYLFHRVEYGNATKVLPRYMQYRATEKICDRVVSRLLGREEKDRGLIWHWQGSGKTLIMVFAANKLFNDRSMENPSIFLVVDRDDLEAQLYDEYTALDLARPEVIASVKDLRAILQHDEGRGKRGIFITLIHKFRPEELSDLQREFESSPDLSIMKRRNVVAFVDEGHRSQYGTLAAQMRLMLKSASFFAFTGTPISKQGRDTYSTFSYPPDEKYLDKYFITDSIDDGHTVKIVYQPRLEEIHLDKAMLDTFLEVEYDEIPEEVKAPLEDNVKRKLNEIKVVLENKERIRKISEDIAEHFKSNVDGKFKAMVVAVSRRACVDYKRALDTLLPKEYSEIVMTFNREDPKPIQDYLAELRQRYAGKEIEEIREEVKEKYKEEAYPRIIIVTDMLITGFDAPILQTMYLDKPLKEHRLLQAIARTNRPYRDVKEAGLILDYVGILKDFVRAFELYSREDIQGVLSNFDEVRQEFISLMDETYKLFAGVPKDRYDRATMMKAIGIITADEESRKKFTGNYKRLRRIFEVLGPDEVKVRLFSEYKWLSAVYTYYLIYVMRQRPSDERYVPRYFEKTLKYVYKSTEIKALEKDLPILDFDSEYLKKLEDKVKSREEKAANIVFALQRFVRTDKRRGLISDSLSERVEKIIRLWREKTKDFEKIYADGSNIVEDILKLEDRQRSLGFDDYEYSALIKLEDRFGNDVRLIDEVKELSKIIKPLTFKGWYSQPSARKNVERETRKFARRFMRLYGISLDDLETIYQKMMESAKQYA